MIKSIHVENYKAFENATIPIKPFTVFLGENSAGKSSIIQLLLMLQQTAERDPGTYDSALLLNGDCTKRGTEKYLFHNFDVSKPLKIEIEIVSDELLKWYKERQFDFIDEFRWFSRFAPILGLQDWRDRNFTNNVDFKTRVHEFLDIINKATVLKQKQKLASTAPFRYGYFSSLDLEKSSDNELYAAYSFLTSLSEILIEKNSFSFSFTLSFSEKNSDEMLRVNSFSLKNNSKTICFCDFLKGDMSSDFADRSWINCDCFQEKKGKSCTIFEVFSFINQESLRTLGKTIKIIADYSIGCLREEFSGSRISHVSPLRAEPLRYYELDNSNRWVHLDTTNGIAIAEVLNGSKSLLANVNTWLNKFRVNVSISKLREVIYKMKVKDTENEDLALDIMDVGFGISQVLPIIVQGFFSRETLMVVEQPEIHLHPQMQADLSDMFIEMLEDYTFNRSFIIETHSEYLLKRLRRRMAENKISPKNVSICLFEKNGDGSGSKITELEINDKGEFPWPDKFFMGELLKDTLQFLN